MNKMIYILPLALAAAACSHKSAPAADDAAAGNPPTVVRANPAVIGYRGGPAGKGSKAIPKATAFRMSGDYAGNVAVTLGNDGQLSYFPATTDITSASRPVDLGDGWWLNRQGIGPGSVFTRYSFEEYSALPSTPSPQEIKDAIIPGARVLKMVSLPYSASEAPSHIAEIKAYLENEK